MSDDDRTPALLNLDALANQTTSRAALKPEVLAAEVGTLGPHWTNTGTELKLVLKGGPMAKQAEVVTAAAKLADELDHHPTITLEYAGLTLTINTHDAQAITMLDLVYAARLEAWLRTNGR